MSEIRPSRRPGTILRFVGRDGVNLVGESWGDRTSPAVVFLHGGGQTRHAWAGTAARVSQQGWRAITIDARGHGESDWSPTGDYRLVSFADDLRLVLARLPGPPVLVGASLGGFTAMLLLGELEPAAARGVVLVDIVPDMEQRGAQRVQGFMLERAHTGFASLEEVAEAVGAYNPRRPASADLEGLRKNLRERDGRFYWHWDPRFMDATTGQLPNEIAEVDRLNAAVERMVADAPVMLVRGRSSDLVSQRKADEFLARFPTVEFVDVTGAGHMVAGDRNDAFTRGVLAFLRRHAETAHEVRDPCR